MEGLIHWKDWCWSWNSNTLATSWEEMTHLKRPCCWVRLKVGGEGDNRGWDGWMASLTQWTWVWVNSGSWWWTGRPGVLQSMRSQRVRCDWSTELNWMEFERASLMAQLVKSTCNARDPGLIPRSGRSTGGDIGYLLQYSWVSLVAYLVKNLPAMRETWVQSWGWEDPLEKGKATHSSILAWWIPWTV